MKGPRGVMRLETGRLAMLIAGEKPTPEEGAKARAIMSFWGIMYLDLLSMEEMRDRYGSAVALDRALEGESGLETEVLGLDVSSPLADHLTLVGGEKPDRHLGALNRRQRRALGR